MSKVVPVRVIRRGRNLIRILFSDGIRRLYRTAEAGRLLVSKFYFIGDLMAFFA